MKPTTFAELQREAIRYPSARAKQVGEGQHFMDVLSPFGEDATVGLTVNR